jgi:hypothetical protein
MKRVFSLVLVFLLFVSMTIPAAAADEAIATTIRLTELNGSVTVQNASGKDVTARADMRLYNGYTVKTGSASSAFISLDDTKAVKLDGNGKVELRKNGKKLEVVLISGKLFFSVDAPLNSDESLEIRTSTVVTGVRGSYGWVSPIETGLLHGHVIVTCRNPMTGRSFMTQLKNGEGIRYEPKADDTPPEGESGDLQQLGFSKSELTTEDIPAIAAEELAKNTELQELLEQEVPTLDVEEIVESAEEKREQETAEELKAEKEVEAQLAEQQQQIEALDKADQKSGNTNEVPFVKDEGTSTTTKPTDDEEKPGRVRPEPEPQPQPQPTIPADAAALMRRLSTEKTVTISTSTPASYSGVTVSSGQTLVISGASSVTLENLSIAEGGAVQVNSNASLTLAGSDLTQKGTLTNSGTVNNTAEIALLKGGKVENTGTYINTGVLAIAKDGEFTGGTVVNNGTIVVNGTFDGTVSGNGVLIQN